ncbi:MAG: type II toxin-antitoxin system RelE/ParE family toxin [Armatimonadetes bacterium]|nr:type II toxin-antitoxin system RelE/ParE family toxin [Armatimonadota bacterium]
MYDIEFSPRARRNFLHLPRQVQERVARELERLCADPFHRGTKALQGGLAPYRRARVGDYRIVYQIETDRIVVLIVEIVHRSGAYRD